MVIAPMAVRRIPNIVKLSNANISSFGGLGFVDQSILFGIKTPLFACVFQPLAAMPMPMVMV